MKKILIWFARGLQLRTELIFGKWSRFKSANVNLALDLSRKQTYLRLTFFALKSYQVSQSLSSLFNVVRCWYFKMKPLQPLNSMPHNGVQ